MEKFSILEIIIFFNISWFLAIKIKKMREGGVSDFVVRTTQNFHFF